MRIDRLHKITENLRQWTAPVRARDLAQEHGVSERSIYRDIDTLRGLGAQIDGAPGFGFTLIEDHTLRPQNFTIDEVEALVLGLREVQEIGDKALSEAAKSALGKLKANLPPETSRQFEHAALHARRFTPRPNIAIDTQVLRNALRKEMKVEISYQDKNGIPSRRRIWPLGIVSMDKVLALLAWCELRMGYRAFRLDRMSEVKTTGFSFRPHRVPKLREFRQILEAENDLRRSGVTQGPGHPS